MTLEVTLPDNPTFAPHLDVRCFDKHVGSVSSILIGAVSISLTSKLEWNTGAYVASDKHLILQEFGKNILNSSDLPESNSMTQEKKVEDEDSNNESLVFFYFNLFIL